MTPEQAGRYAKAALVAAGAEVYPSDEALARVLAGLLANPNVRPHGAPKPTVEYR